MLGTLGAVREGSSKPGVVVHGWVFVRTLIRWITLVNRNTAQRTKQAVGHSRRCHPFERFPDLCEHTHRQTSSLIFAPLCCVRLRPINGRDYDGRMFAPSYAHVFCSQGFVWPSAIWRAPSVRKLTKKKAQLTNKATVLDTPLNLSASISLLVTSIVNGT